MRIIPKILQRRCQVCRRYKDDAVHEQVERLQACGIEHCAFSRAIQNALREAQKAELISFNISKTEILEGDSITIGWETKNCNRVWIKNFREVDKSGVTTIQVQRGTAAIEIVLEDLFGETFEVSMPIQVYSKPTIEILELKDKVLDGEQYNFTFKTTAAQIVHLNDVNGNLIEDLSGKTSFTSRPVRNDRELIIVAFGKFGSEVRQTLTIQVFQPPAISFFNASAYEIVDTMPVDFEFAYSNAEKAHILCDNILIAEVTDKFTFCQVAENTKESVISSNYELKVTGFTGTVVQIALKSPISIYPQPRINDIELLPDKAILFPQQITINNTASFCEKILLSDGHSEIEVNPNSSVSFEPSQSTEFSLIPLGKSDFQGQPKSTAVEVYHPVEISLSASERIVMPNIPVTISWTAKNHSQLILEPGNIDVTYLSSYDLRLEKGQNITIWAINKKNRKKAEFFVDVIPFPKIENRIKLPEPELKLARNSVTPNIKVETPKLRIGHISDGITLSRLKQKSMRTERPLLARYDFNLSKAVRNKMYSELKALLKKNLRNEIL